MDPTAFPPTFRRIIAGERYAILPRSNEPSKLRQPLLARGLVEIYKCRVSNLTVFHAAVFAAVTTPSRWVSAIPYPHPLVFGQSTITSALLSYVTDCHPCEELHPSLLPPSSTSSALAPPPPSFPSPLLFKQELNGSRRLLMVSKRPDA